MFLRMKCESVTKDREKKLNLNPQNNGKKYYRNN